MNKIKPILGASILLLVSVQVNASVKSFDISFITQGYSTSNALGLAVNPFTGNIHKTTLSYNGAGNLWELDTSGNLISSHRAVFDTGSGNFSGSTFDNNGHYL